MVRGTTPTFIIRIPNVVDLTTANHVYCTLKQGTVKVRKDGADVEVSPQSAAFSLTQAESLLFRAGTDAKVQMNWTYDGGSRGATKEVCIKVEDNTEPEVLP